MSITREDVLAMTSFEDISKAVKNPETTRQMQSLLTDRQVAVHVSKLMQARAQQQAEAEQQLDSQIASVTPPTTEELAAEAAEIAGAPVEVPPVAAVDTSAEDAEYKEAGVDVYRDVTGKVTRLVQEYQVRDDDGNAIGRPTHLEAKSALDLLGKQRKAHEEAVRFGYRMKKHKTTFKPEAKTILTAEELKAAAEQVVSEKDVNKAEEIVRAAIESQYSKRDTELKNKEAYAEGRALSNEFRARHLHDYNPCEANQNALKEYFSNNDLEFNLDNLEIAFAVLMNEEKLVKVSQPFQRSVEVAANPAPTTATTPAATEGTPPVAQPVAVQTPVAAEPQAVSKPVVQATVTTPATPNNSAPVARRPGVNGSLPPGSMSAHRPVQVDPAQARKDFMKKIRNMSAEAIKRERDTNPQFVKELATYGIKLQ